MHNAIVDADCRCPMSYYERVSAANERVHLRLGGKSEYSRPNPAQPGPITVGKALYLENRKSDRQAVFFDEYHLDVKVVWCDSQRAPGSPTARGACQSWTIFENLQYCNINNGTTAGPIGLKFSM